MLVLDRQAAHRAEAGQDQRVHAGLGAAGEDDVRVASADDLGSLADGVRPGRAGRDGRVVRAAHAERDRDLAARRVDEHARDEVRRDAVRAPLVRGSSLCSMIPRKPPIAEPKTTPTRAGIEAVQRSRPPSPRRRRRRASSTLRSSRRASFGFTRPVGIEVLDLGGDPHRELARVERLDEVDAALARDRGAPRRRRVVAQRRDGTQTCDRDSPHCG